MSNPSSIARLSLHRDLELGCPGAPGAVILTPAEAAYRELGLALAAAIESRTGVALPVEDAACYVQHRPRVVWPDRLRRHFILLGQFWNNPVLERLYAGFFDPTDALYPGPGGYELRTICRPFVDGHNCLVATGSDLEGCRRAVAELPAHIGSGAGRAFVPFLHEVHLAGEALQVEQEYRAKVDPKLEQIEAYAQWGHPEARLWTGENPCMARLYATRNWGAAGTFAIHYWLSGNPADARASRCHLLDLAKNMDLVREVQASGMLYTEYDIITLIVGWDLIEDTGVFTEAERQTITNIIYELIETNKDSWFIVRCRDLPLADIDFGGRHLIGGTLGYGLAARYFARNCLPTPQQAQDLAGLQAHAAQYLRRLSQSYFYSDGTSVIHDDGEMAMRYALLTGDLDYVDNGALRGLADYYVAGNDNLGRYASAGLQGGGVQSPRGGATLNAAGYFYPESGYQWFRRRLGRWVDTCFCFYHEDWWGIGSRYYNWEMPPSAEGSGVIERQATGITVLPVPQAFSEFSQRDREHWRGGVGHVPGRYYYDPVPFDRSWKRIVLRSGLERDDQYFLLDGMQGVEWSFDDVQAIHYYNDLGRRLLTPQPNKLNITRLEMNTLFASGGRPGNRQSVAAELEGAADLGPHGLVRTRVANHDGGTWSRSVLWVKEAFFLLADEFTPHAAGPHLLCQTWVSMDRFAIAEGEAQTLPDEPGAPQLHVIATPERAVASLAAEDGVYRLQHTVTAGLELGQPLALWTLLQATGEARPTPWTMKRIAPGAVVLAGEERTVLAFAGALDLGSLHIEAALGLIEAGRLTLLGCHKLALAGAPLIEAPAGEGISLGWDLAANAFEPGKPGYGLQPGAAPEGLAAGRDAVARALRAGLLSAAQAPEDIAHLGPAGSATETAVAGVEHLQLAAPVSLAAADLNGDGTDELLLYRDDLSPRFALSTLAAEPVAVDFGGQGRPDIAVSTGRKVAIYAPEGRLQFEHEANLDITSLAAGDLNGDGREELDLGLYDWAITLDHAGRRLFDAEVIGRQPIARRFAPVGAGGRVEVVAAGGVGNVSVHSPEGGVRAINFQSYFSIKPCRLWVQDLDGDGQLECYVGGSETDLACYDLNGLRLLWTFGGIPIHPNDVALADVDGDSRPEFVCGGNDGFLYVVDPAGRFLFSRHVGSPITRLLAVAGGAACVLIAGLQTGRLLLYRQGLELAGSVQVSERPVRHLAVLRRAGGGPEVMAADAEGSAIRFRL